MDFWNLVTDIESWKLRFCQSARSSGAEPEGVWSAGPRLIPKKKRFDQSPQYSSFGEETPRKYQHPFAEREASSVDGYS